MSLIDLAEFKRVLQLELYACRLVVANQSDVAYKLVILVSVLFTRGPQYDRVVSSRINIRPRISRIEIQVRLKTNDENTSIYEIRPYVFFRGRINTRSYLYKVVYTRIRPIS